MIRNYFKVAFRNLWRNKGYSAINIFGLATGLATCLVIILFITDELSYDRFYKNADRIYRINSDITFGGSNLHFTMTSDMMGQLLKKDYPQVEEYTRIYTNEGDKLIKKGNEFIDEFKIAYADSTFFNVFQLPSVEGDTKTALMEPNTIVISESAAKKYFADGHALGKVLEIKNGASTTPFKVTAVIKDMPANSHIGFDFLMSMKNADYQWGQLTSHNFRTYLLLKPGTDPKKFDKNFISYINNYLLPQVKQVMNINSMDDFKKAGNHIEYSMMPITRIHLYSDYTFEVNPPGNIRYVYIFGAVALFILVIACINFINLSTARSARRAKEVGIRKTLGTERKTLVIQFLIESTITVLISLVIALVITWQVLPFFNNISGKSITMANLLTPEIISIICLIPFVVGLLAGSYPALYLSGFNPIKVLKSNSAGAGFKKSMLRNALVVFQFTSSIILIISTIVIYNQLNYIQNKKVGFNKDQILIINGASALDNNAKAFKDEVLKMPGVISGTLSSFLPVSTSSRSDNTFSKDAVMDTKNGIDMQVWKVDYDYLKTMGMQMKKGRFFSKDFADSNAVVINETTAAFLGYDDPVGKKIYTIIDNNGNSKGLDIIGVVGNFNFESLRQKVGPLCMRLGNSTGLASFKISADAAKKLVPQIESQWKVMASGVPFSHRFLDDAFNQMYNEDQKIGKLAISFSMLAILIACLGLFGLATYIAEQRTKEIGIRKVLGASVSNVVNMLSKDFVKLVLLSSFIAFPLAWWAMNKWLQDFAYRTYLSWWIFLVAALTALFVALLTVSTQAIKAAVSNPVKSLRTE